MIPPIVEKKGSEIKINLFPKQAQFVNSDVDDLFFGGQVGGAKSTAVIMGACLRRMKFPGSTGLILRRTYPELEKSLIQKSREIYPFFGATYHETKKCWTFPNGSLQYFGFCETDKDVYSYQSAEYQDIWIDESTHMTEFQITYITSRCRSTIPGCKPLIRLASNPGNTGHLFHKKRYIEPYKKQKIWKDERTGKTMSFIPSSLEDNPAMMELDPTYKSRLRELGETKYKALAEGDWDVYEGAYFDWDEKIGVLPYKRVPDTDTFKFLAMDWGFKEPCCVLWFEVMPSGRIYCYRELYVTNLSNPDLAKTILQMSPSNEKYEYMVCEVDIWFKQAEQKEGGESIQQQMEAVLGTRIPLIKANKNRIAGWNKMQQYFAKAGDGRPWLMISPVCENLIRTIPTMIHDDKNPNDVDSAGENHAPECCRYALMSLTGIMPGSEDENLSPYERIFGVKSDEAKNVSYLPVRGHGGYG